MSTKFTLTLPTQGQAFHDMSRPVYQIRPVSVLTVDRRKKDNKRACRGRFTW